MSRAVSLLFARDAEVRSAAAQTLFVLVANSAANQTRALRERWAVTNGLRRVARDADWERWTYNAAAEALGTLDLEGPEHEEGADAADATASQRARASLLRESIEGRFSEARRSDS